MTTVNIKNLVLFVTGASKENGLGAAIVQEAIKRGAKKIYASARKKSDLDYLVTKSSKKVMPVTLDVTNQKEIQIASRIAGDVNILINNAGTVGETGCFYNYNEEISRREFEVNFFGPLRLMNAFSNNLIHNNSAAIVNVMSIGALYPSPNHVSYSASKAALYSLVQAMRIEMARHSHAIPIFGVFPGPIATQMSQNLNVQKESAENVAKRIFDGMTEGKMDITTDVLSDLFQSYLKKDLEPIKAIKEAFQLKNSA